MHSWEPVGVVEAPRVERKREVRHRGLSEGRCGGQHLDQSRDDNCGTGDSKNFTAHLFSVIEARKLALDLRKSNWQRRLFFLAERGGCLRMKCLIVRRGY